jgi:hypothetical protein
MNIDYCIREMSSNKKIIVFILMSLIFYWQCTGNRIQRIITPSEDIAQLKASKETPFIKLHMREGGVFILNDWNTDLKSKTISGSGKQFDYNRALVDSGKYDILLNDVVLAETNSIKEGTGSSVLATMSVITGIVGIICITNPKACFGSCPTFYFNNGDNYIIQSEGFSASIAPALEDYDIDALYKSIPVSEQLELQLRNEAMETHVIRSADLLALKKKDNARIYVTPDERFIEAYKHTEPAEVIGYEGSIFEKVYDFDGKERFSSADSVDLSVRECIDITFCNSNQGEKGLVIASRQTLLTTFLVYQALAYMGNQAGEWIAHLERNKNTLGKYIKSPGKLLGNIEIFIADSAGNWIKAGEVGETGPIATDIKLVPLGNFNSGSDIKIRLKLTKGLWRIDYLALADLGDDVKPLLIQPNSAFPETSNGSKITELLTNPDSVLVTLPGDKYLINYKLPENFMEYEYFLKSRGYYIEWMREEWVSEENPQKVLQLFYNSKQALKDLAPEFKKIESEMEETFWSSKYVLP